MIVIQLLNNQWSSKGICAPPPKKIKIPTNDDKMFSIDHVFNIRCNTRHTTIFIKVIIAWWNAMCSNLRNNLGIC